jgi:acyl-CoA reductase-like NAD-dependent aldehyde dehydrogenase
MTADCGAVNINDVITNLMCTTAPMGGWKTSGIGARFGGAEGMRKYCRVETVVGPRTDSGRAGASASRRASADLTACDSR